MQFVCLSRNTPLLLRVYSDVRRSVDFSPAKFARIAGALYVIVIATGFFAEMAVRQRLVARDAAETLANIAAHEQLFRAGFAADVLGGLCVVPLMLLLFELLRPVDRRAAILGLLFSTVGLAIQQAALMGHFLPVVLLHTPGIEPGALRIATAVALRVQSVGYGVALAFFGGTMLTRGYLIVRSTFLPTWLGVFLAAEGVAYLANSFTTFLAPALAGRVFAVLLVTGLAEVLLALWLLIVGVNEERWRAATPTCSNTAE